MYKSAETFHAAPKPVHLVQTDIPETTGGHVTASRQRKVRMKPPESMHKFASALIDELEKQAMHPAMEAQQAKYKARMDDKDGDGKKEPDTEEVSKKERLAELMKKTASQKNVKRWGHLGPIPAALAAKEGRRGRTLAGALKGSVTRGAKTAVKGAALGALVGGPAAGILGAGGGLVGGALAGGLAGSFGGAAVGASRGSSAGGARAHGPDKKKGKKK